MALDLTLLNADVSNIIADLPVTVVTQYDTVTGSKSSLGRLDFLVDEGMRERIAFSVFLKISELTTIPDIDETCTILGVIYEIVGKSTDDTDQLLRLDLAELDTDF